jgi:hypothetical protein
VPDDLLTTAVATLLRQAPDSWADSPIEEGDALAVLTAAGFVERRITFTVRLPGDDKPQRITIELTGEYGLVEAMTGVVQDLWAKCGERWRELRAETGEPIKPIVAFEGDEWRMTDQGRLARDDLERDATVPINFVLRRGFFNSREPVRGQGRLVRIENAASGPLAVDLAKCSAAPEIAQALATAFSGALAAVIPPVNATPKADATDHDLFLDVKRAVDCIVGGKNTPGVSRLIAIAKSQDSVDRRLYLIGKLGLLKPDVSAAELAALLGCSDAAVKKTRWWRSRMAQRRQQKADADVHYHRKYGRGRAR